MMASFARVACILLLFPLLSSARSWNDITSVSEVRAVDSAGRGYLETKEQMLLDHAFSENAIPDATERVPTTNQPSPMPSTAPSDAPSVIPSEAPSLLPSTFPSVLPSEIPSSVPTLDPFPPVTPKDPNQFYFNYDDADGSFGPDGWGSVEPGSYWDEFDKRGFGPWRGYLEKRDPSKNVCEKGDRQSPIDLKESGAKCHEFHEVRDKPGDFAVTGDDIEKRIENNKLRLHYRRRPCADTNRVECQEPDPPFADFPYGWGGVADVIHIDIKVPSEHTVKEERFDAEMQIYHLHPERKRVAALSVLIRAKSGGYNYYMQEALKAFQKQYDKNAAKCRRRSMEQQDYIWDDHFSTASNSTFSTGKERNLQFKEGKPWNPYHPMLIPTIHFWRYDGSLTEPPCFEAVSWWVADKPMIISEDQLEQMQAILFTNVDSKCRMTSAHHDRSVARPIQKTNGRDVYLCTPDDFGPDK